MNGLLAETLRPVAIAFAMLGTALVGTAAPAAEIGRPVRLFPDAGTLPAPATSTEAVGVGDAALTILVERGATGLLDAATGALPAGLWAGSTRDRIDPLLLGLQPPRHAALRDLVRRALASPGDPPAAEDAASRPDFAALRARSLFRLGDAAGARSLAERATRGQSEPTAMAVIRDALFLATDPRPACAWVRDPRAESGAPDWMAGLVTCQTLAGDTMRARLGLTMLHDAGSDDDWLDRFVALADGTRRALDGGRAPLAPHHFALLAAARVPLPAAAIASVPQAILVAIAGSDAVPPDTRLRAAEAAVAGGALDGVRLAALYDAAIFSPAETADLRGFADRDSGPRSRAAFHRLLKTSDASARARLYAEAQALAERRGAGRAFRRAAAETVANLAPVPDDEDSIASVIRTLLADGRAFDAQRWFALLREGAGITPTGVQLAPLMVLSGAAGPELLGPELLRAWRDAQGRGGVLRVRLLAEILDALGLPVTGLTPLAASPPALAPVAALLTQLSQAVEQRALGEAILLAAAAAATDAAQDRPLAIAAAIRALRALAFEDGARALALDAALLAGL